MNKIKTMWRLSRMELMQSMRSTKIIILSLFVIFINMLVIEPLRTMSAEMGHRLSVFEPFAAIGNSGFVVLILPLFFITLMADFPREGDSRYFYQIRCSKRIWIISQILYAAESAVVLTLFVFVVSVLLSLDFVSWSFDYSYAVTNYVSVFPERRNDYVLQLIPQHLYNQAPLGVIVVHTAFLLVLYFLMLAMLILVFYLLKKKILGIFLDVLLVLLGAVTCACWMKSKWILPMAHTIMWLHYTEYQSEPIMAIPNSYLYFGVINVALIVSSVLMSKRYDSI